MNNLDFLTHYYLPDRRPFQNLSDLSKQERDQVAHDLNQRSESGAMKRAFPDWYFKQRKEAEQNLYKQVIAQGYQPERNNPHYLCLGKSLGMEYVYNHDFKIVKIPLSDIKEPVFYSIGDTLWTFAQSHNPAQKWINKWYQGKLYNYEETIAIIQQIDLDLTNPHSLNTLQVFHIEALIWSNNPLANYL